MADSAVQRNQVARELERALAAKATLQQERLEMRQKVARSPKKISPKKPANPPGPRKPPQKALIPAIRDAKPAMQQGSPSKHRRTQSQSQPVPETTAIMAFRPDHPTESEEALIDDAIAKSVANMLQTPAPQRGTRIVALPAEAHARAEQASPLSPAFLTSKRRNMHCELDEPGLVVPYPRHSVRRPGFFARLFSCFRPPPEVFPPSPYKMQTQTPSGMRPGSGRVTPPTLKLGSEMEPLRQSLASLRPGLAAEALAAISNDEAVTPNDDPGLRRAHRRLLLAAGHAGQNPPTPRLGGSMALQAQNPMHPAMRRVARDLDTHSESSFESLEAEHSDGEVESPFDGVMYRRTPVAGPDGRPLVQVCKQPTPEQQKHPYYMDPSAANNPHAMALQTALMQAMTVPLPPSGDARPRGYQTQPGATPSSDYKQTQVSLAELMGPGRGRRQQGRRGQEQQPRGRSASHQEGYWEEEQQPRGRRTSRQQEDGYSRRYAARSAGPPSSRHASFQAPTRHASASPTRYRQAQPSVPQQQQQQQRSAGYRSAPVSPQRRNSGPMQQHFEQYFPQQYAAAAAAKQGNAKSAPASRAASPLREPAVRPRMNKASAARTEATQRLLENRRQREIAHLGQSFGPQPRMPKRKESAPADDHPAEAPAKRPRSAEKNQDIEDYGFFLPAAGTQPESTPEPAKAVRRTGGGGRGHGAAQGQGVKSPKKGLGTRKLGKGAQDPSSDPASAPPRSPAFYRMLERLALGMSVDVDKVKASKRPTEVPLPLQDLVGNGSSDVTRSQPSRTVLVTPNALFSGKEDVSPSQSDGDKVGQRMVSMTEAAAPRGNTNDSCSRGSRDSRDSHRSRGSKDTRGSKDSRGSRRRKKGGEPRGEVVTDPSSSDALLGQLLDMERSLTMDDLALLRQAIRREGGAAVAYAE